MEYIYGALLLHSAGKEVNEDGLKKVLEAAGLSVDAARVKAVVTSLGDVDIDEAMKTAVAAPAVGAPAAAAPSGEGKEEEKKEEKEEEEEEEGATEEEAMAGLGALFG